jgi:hypothetical protein
MGLRVIETVQRDAGEDPFEPVVRRRAVGRPGDVRDPWTLAGSTHLEAVAEEARLAGIDLPTAVGLVVECVLTEIDLGRLGLARALAPIDEHAAAVHLDGGVAPADALYLRSLGSSTPAVGGGKRPGVVALPARFATRLLRAGGPDAVIAPCRLERAIAWELAAVAAGRTMSEWALAVALELELEHAQPDFRR